MTGGPRGPTAGPGDAAFQRLWTKYAALPQYDKAEWTAAFNEIWESPGAPPAARRAPTDAMIDAAYEVLMAYWPIPPDPQPRTRKVVERMLRAAQAADVR